MTHPLLGAALIGVGMVAPTYAAALSQLTDRITLTGALASGPTSARNFLDEHAPTGRAYASIDEIAQDPAITFVLLITPPNARREIVQTLAAAGKHILMEKPVERTLTAAAELCDIAERYDITLGLMLQHRARPAALALRGMDLGPLRAVEIAVPWWRPQSYYDAPGRGTYARDGGGVLITQAIHTLDLALQFTGPVTEVLAQTDTLHDMEAEDFVTAALRFENGAPGTLFASNASFPGRAERIILHHTQASAILEANQLTIAWRDGRTERHGADAPSGAGADPVAFAADLHRDMIADFAVALSENRAPLAPARSALPVHSLIQAIERSGKTGTRLTLS